jgi:hypothetical protein
MAEGPYPGAPMAGGQYEDAATTGQHQYVPAVGQYNPQDFNTLSQTNLQHQVYDTSVRNHGTPDANPPAWYPRNTAVQNNVGYMDQMPHTAINPSVADLSPYISPYAGQHETPQQLPLMFPVQPPMVNQPMIANPRSGERPGRNNAGPKKQQGSSEAAIDATSTPEFPSIVAFLSQRSSQETALHPCDYVFKDYTDKPLNFTAVELITFLPGLCASLGICNRLLKAKMSNPTHWQISTTHRSDSKDVRHIASEIYLNTMRRRDENWQVKIWLKTWKPPQDWVCVMEMRDFEPDRVVYNELQAPVPMPVPFTDLLRGVKKCPTGYDAADLTRAINHACEKLEKDGTVYMFPTDLEKILDEAGRTVITLDHRDDMVIKRYKKQYEDDRKAMNNANDAGQKRAASPTPPSQAQLPALQPKRQKPNAANQRQLAPQQYMEKDPLAGRLMKLTEVRGDETAEVNQLIRFAQRPDQVRIPWRWIKKDVDQAQEMLQKEAKIVQKEKMTWENAIRRQAQQGDAQQHNQNNVAGHPTSIKSQFQNGFASDLEFRDASQDVQHYDQTPGKPYPFRNDHSSSPEFGAELTVTDLMTPNESQGMTPETPASSVTNPSYVDLNEWLHPTAYAAEEQQNVDATGGAVAATQQQDGARMNTPFSGLQAEQDSVIDPQLLDGNQAAMYAERSANMQAVEQQGETDVSNPPSSLTIPFDFDSEFPTLGSRDDEWMPFVASGDEEWTQFVEDNNVGLDDPALYEMDYQALFGDMPTSLTPDSSNVPNLPTMPGTKQPQEIHPSLHDTLDFGPPSSESADKGMSFEDDNGNVLKTSSSEE